MQVSYYELLGMIKENINPEKIILKDIVYTWNGENYLGNNDEYIAQDLSEYEMFDKNIILALESTEITEEDKEIEELKLCSFNKFKTMSPEERYHVTAIEYDKLNEVIRKVNKIEKEGKK